MSHYRLRTVLDWPYNTHGNAQYRDQLTLNYRKPSNIFTPAHIDGRKEFPWSTSFTGSEARRIDPRDCARWMASQSHPTGLAVRKRGASRSERGGIRGPVRGKAKARASPYHPLARCPRWAPHVRHRHGPCVDRAKQSTR